MAHRHWVLERCLTLTDASKVMDTIRGAGESFPFVRLVSSVVHGAIPCRAYSSRCSIDTTIDLPRGGAFGAQQV